MELQILISQLDKIFKFRSEDEKKAYLTIVLKNFDYLQSIAMGQSEKKERLTELNLNNQLMLKGLLLNNSKNILLKLNTLNDSEIDNKIIIDDVIKDKFQLLQPDRKAAYEKFEAEQMQEQEIIFAYGIQTTESIETSVDIVQYWILEDVAMNLLHCSTDESSGRFLLEPTVSSVYYMENDTSTSLSKFDIF